jgi:hypothetical protein
MNLTILNLNYLLHDQQTLRYNTVESIEWSAEKTEGIFSVERHSTVDLPAPGNDFIPFEDITEEKALIWLRNTLGPSGLQAIEDELDAELSELVNPTHGSGRPWTESGI